MVCVVGCRGTGKAVSGGKVGGVSQDVHGCGAGFGKEFRVFGKGSLVVTEDFHDDGLGVLLFDCYGSRDESGVGDRIEAGQGAVGGIICGDATRVVQEVDDVATF